MGSALWPANTLWKWTGNFLIIFPITTSCLLFQVNWETNIRKCHSIGMTPIIIENDKKRSCLNSWNTKGIAIQNKNTEEYYYFAQTSVA